MASQPSAVSTAMQPSAMRWGRASAADSRVSAADRCVERMVACEIGHRKTIAHCRGMRKWRSRSWFPALVLPAKTR